MNGRAEPHLTDQDKLKALHIVYCAETGNQMRLTMPILDDWMRWASNGWTADDLRTVIRYIKKRFYRREQPQYAEGMMSFRKLIRPEYVEAGPDFSYFEGLLCSAKKEARNERPKPTQRETVLREANRPAPETQHENGCKRFGDWMEQNDEWKTMKKNLGL